MMFLRRLWLYIFYIHHCSIFITGDFREDIEALESPSITINHLDVMPTHYDVKLTSIFKRDGEKYTASKHGPFDTYIEEKYTEEHQANASFVFYGELNVTIVVLRPTKEISLNSSDSILFLSSRFEMLGPLFKEFDFYLKKYNCNTEILNIVFNETLSRGSYKLNFIFLNAINNTENIIIPLTVPTRGSKRTMSDETYFQVIGARRLFPCWDDIPIKTTFKISVNHHRKYKVFSNMPIQKEEESKNETHWRMTNITCDKENKNWTYFAMTPPIFTYAVTIAFLPMKFCRIETHRFIASRRLELHSINMDFAELIVNKVINQLDYKMIYMNRNIQTQFVAVFGLPYNYENWGLVINRESDIIYNKSRHSDGHKIDVARLITRQITYQLFGDLINSFWSCHFWLINGLSTLLGIHALNDIEEFSSSGILNLFIVQAHYESLRLDSYFSIKSLGKKTSFPENKEFFHYIKAPLVWYKVKHLITDEIFWQSIRYYYNIRRFISTTPNDFWAIFIQQIVEDKSFSEQVKQDMCSLTAMLNDLTKYREYPVLKITRNNSANSINITIENYDILKEYYDFWIPVTYTTQNSLNFNDLNSVLHDERLIIMPSHKPFRQIFVADDGWVIFNLRQTGYYRVNYDVENWQKIAKYLNSKKYAKIHVINRAKLIDDAFHFMIAQQMDSSIFWNLTSYLAQETSYIPWYPMIKALEHMSSIFPLSNKNVENIKVKIIKMLDGLLSKIKYEEDPEEIAFTKCLRQEAIKWACILGDSNCQRIAYKNMEGQIYKREEEVKLLPWWKEWIYCKGLMSASNVVWNLMMNDKLDGQFNYRFVEFLACSENNTVNYLKLSTQRNRVIGKLATNSIDSLFFSIAKHAKNNTVLNYILTNFEKLKPRSVSGLAVFTTIVNHVYTEKQLDAIRNMENSIRNILITEISNRIHDTIKPNITLFQKVEDKLTIRLSEIKKQTDYLRNFLEKGELKLE